MYVYHAYHLYTYHLVIFLRTCFYHLLSSVVLRTKQVDNFGLFGSSGDYISCIRMCHPSIQVSTSTQVLHRTKSHHDEQGIRQCAMRSGDIRASRLGTCLHICNLMVGLIHVIDQPRWLSG